jgi:hypothetical protein
MFFVVAILAVLSAVAVRAGDMGNADMSDELGLEAQQGQPGTQFGMQLGAQPGVTEQMPGWQNMGGQAPGMPGQMPGWQNMGGQTPGMPGQMPGWQNMGGQTPGMPGQMPGMQMTQNFSGMYVGMYMIGGRQFNIQANIQQNGNQVGGQVVVPELGGQPMPIVSSMIMNGMLGFGFITYGPTGMSSIVLSLQPTPIGLEGMCADMATGQNGSASLRRMQ